MKIRPAWMSDAPALARVHIDAWRTTYRGVFPEDRLAALSYGHHEDIWTSRLDRAPEQHRVIFVAETDYGQVVGFSTAGPDTADGPGSAGELYAIYVLEAHQRQGLGRRLIHAAADALAQAGCPNVALWVLTDNQPARRFYEALGGRVVRERAVTLFDVTVNEVAVTWDDIATLVSASSPRDA